MKRASGAPGSASKKQKNIAEEETIPNDAMSAEEQRRRAIEWAKTVLPAPTVSKKTKTVKIAAPPPPPPPPLPAALAAAVAYKGSQQQPPPPPPPAEEPSVAKKIRGRQKTPAKPPKSEAIRTPVSEEEAVPLSRSGASTPATTPASKPQPKSASKSSGSKSVSMMTNTSPTLNENYEPPTSARKVQRRKSLPKDPFPVGTK
jgi:hypothetical protein